MSSQPQHSNDNVVVSSGTGKRKILALHRTTSLIVTIIVVLAVIVTTWLIWEHHLTQVRQKEAAQKKHQLLANANKDIASGNYKAAIDAINNAPSTEETDMLLVSAYVNKGDYKSALTVYQQVIKKYGANLGLVEGAASAAEGAHDYKQAIAYYQQAKQLVAQEKGDATQQADEAYYTTKIESLQKLAQ